MKLLHGNLVQPMCIYARAHLVIHEQPALQYEWESHCHPLNGEPYLIQKNLPKRGSGIQTDDPSGIHVSAAG